MTVLATCPKCNALVSVPLDVEGIDAELAQALVRLASHSLCAKCGHHLHSEPKPEAIRTPYRDD